jgi:hypothetical protein
MERDWVLSFLRAASLSGILLFTAVFAAVALAPQLVERSARQFIAYKLSAEIERFLPGSTQGDKAPSEWRLSEETLAELAQAQEQLQEKFRQGLEKFLARLCQYDCGKLEAFKSFALDLFRGLSAQAFDNLRSIAQERYSAVLAKIRRELLIFSGINLLSFALVFLATFFRPARVRSLRIPVWLLFLATAMSIWSYIFERNWFFAILFDRYLGIGYAGIIVSAFLYMWLRHRATRL